MLQREGLLKNLSTNIARKFCNVIIHIIVVLLLVIGMVLVWAPAFSLFNSK